MMTAAVGCHDVSCVESGCGAMYHLDSCQMWGYEAGKSTHWRSNLPEHIESFHVKVRSMVQRFRMIIIVVCQMQTRNVILLLVLQ